MNMFSSLLSLIGLIILVVGIFNKIRSKSKGSDVNINVFSTPGVTSEAEQNAAHAVSQFLGSESSNRQSSNKIIVVGSLLLLIGLILLIIGN